MRTAGQTGQSSIEYGLFYGIVAVVCVAALSSLGVNMSALFGKTAQETDPGGGSPMAKLLGLVAPPSGGNAAFPSLMAGFAIEGAKGRYAISMDPTTGAVAVTSANGANTTSVEGDRISRDVTMEMLEQISAFAESGKLPDGTALNDAERSALRALALSGHKLAGAELWMTESPKALQKAGLLPENLNWVPDTAQNYTAWALEDSGLQQEDINIILNITRSYNGFRQEYLNHLPVLTKNPSLSSFVSPLVATIDSLAYNNFLMDPANTGNNPEGRKLIQSLIEQPVYPSLLSVGDGTHRPPELTDLQAVQYTYSASVQFSSQSSTSVSVTSAGTPSYQQIVQSDRF